MNRTSRHMALAWLCPPGLNEMRGLADTLMKILHIHGFIANSHTE